MNINKGFRNWGKMQEKLGGIDFKHMYLGF